MKISGGEIDKLPTNLWAYEQHRAVLGAQAEGQVVDQQSLFLA